MSDQIQRYRYAVISFSGQTASEQEDTINTLAKTGWELVTVSNGYAYMEQPFTPLLMGGDGNGNNHSEKEVAP